MYRALNCTQVLDYEVLQTFPNISDIDLYVGQQKIGLSSPSK
jgi:hypothetical protein